MADDEIDDSEFKDEELVDFEGSDYGFGSEEELEIEAEVFGIQVIETQVQESSQRKADEDAEFQNEPVSANVVDSIKDARSEDQRVRNDESSLADLQKASDFVHSNNREGAESGEIEEERDDKDEGVVLQPVSSSFLDTDRTDVPVKIDESRQRKHRKADLEDGELDDAAMPEGYDLVAEGKDDSEIVGRERKRRKDRFIAERQAEGSEGNEAKESEEIGSGALRHQRFRGSDRLMERLAGFTKTGGGRGINMRMMGFGQASMAPGIMGPGRPLLPVDLSAAFGFRPLGRGFGPLGGIASPGRPNIHLQEVLAQEHLLRSRAMQLAHGSIPGSLRSPMTNPLGAAALRPFMGLDFVGPGPHSLMQFQPQGPDVIAQMNFVGPVDNFARGPRPNFAVGRAGVSGNMGGRTDSSPRNGIGRQGSWSTAPTSGEMQHVGRGRAQGRGHPLGPLWADAQALGHIFGGQGLPAGHMNIGNVLNVGAAQGVAPGVPNLSSGKLRQGGQGPSAPQREGNTGLNEFDARWKLEKERMLRNGVHNGVVEDGNLAESTRGCSKNFDSGRKIEDKISAPLSNSTPIGIIASTSSAPRANSTPVGNVANTSSTAGSNLIRLLQPVRKSRVLTVSGLPENTPMSTIVEAFEKQGKITDFRKDEKGDRFTISFSTETEAISAKRHLHRSFLAGRQITVDYAYQ